MPSTDPSALNRQQDPAPMQGVGKRFSADGVVAVNKQLPAPLDFTAILVLAPEGAAGLHDFLAAARRLDVAGVCRVTYAYCRFQGEGAAMAMGGALQAALDLWDSTTTEPPDAIAIVCDAEPGCDMGWLHDADLARYIGDLPVPVFTGIAHERDSTPLDAAAHTRFATPITLIYGIQQAIAQRAALAKANFEQLIQKAGSLVRAAKAQAGALDASLRAQACRQLAIGQQSSANNFSVVRKNAMQSMRNASVQSGQAWQQVEVQALAHQPEIERDRPELWNQITFTTKHAQPIATAQHDGPVEALPAKTSWPGLDTLPMAPHY